MNKFLLPTLLLLIQVMVTAQKGHKHKSCLPSSCADIRSSGGNSSGIYKIYPKPWFAKSNITVYCDMETDGGGWTLFQRRGDYKNQQSFIQNWSAYSKGFGNLNKDFWLGNDNIHILTNQEYVSLRIDMEDFNGVKRFVNYNRFIVLGCHDRYRLNVEQYSGTTVDNMSYHNNKTFVTFDDGDVYKCAAVHNGGWWYSNCHQANLNGLYKEADAATPFIYWYGYGKKALKKTEMKVRPSHFSILQVSD